LESCGRFYENVRGYHETSYVIMNVLRFRRKARAAEEKHTKRDLSSSNPHTLAKFGSGIYPGKVECGEEGH
jgi:hypothetical protein